MSGQEKLVIGYWKIRGLGAPCRMVCEYAEADYVNEQYEVKGDEKEWDFSAWFSVKPALQKRNALMNLPYIIDSDGFVVTQSVACLIYLGRKFKLYGSNSKETAMIDQILCEAQDLRNNGVKVFYGSEPAGLQDYLEKTVPYSYAKFEGWLKAQAVGPYTVGETPTVGDFHLWEMLDQGELLAVDHVKESPLKNFPNLKKLYDAIRAEPKLQRYFSGPLYHNPVNSTMAIWGNKPRSIGELYYFQVRARAEPLRLLLRYARIPYANHLVAGADWPKFKETVPNGALPVIKLPDGSFLDDTPKLARYIAVRAGAPLMPIEEEKQKAAAEMFEISNEKFGKTITLSNLVKVEDAEKDIPDALEIAVKELAKMEEELASLKEPFFGGEQPHYGEFGLFHAVNIVLTLSKKASSEIPAIWMKWYSAMAGLPAVKEYLSERPQAGTGKTGFPGSRMFTLKLDA